VRLGYYEDETGSASHWHFPLAHFLEAWGDAVASDGTLLSIQPLIAPLFGSLSDLEFLARLAGLARPAQTRSSARLSPASQARMRSRLEHVSARRFCPGHIAKTVSASFNPSAFPRSPLPAAPSKGSLEVVLYRDMKADDGRYANNGWLQELPDPITKLVWDNAVLVSRKTARELGVENNDVVEVALGERKIKGAI